MLRHASHGPYHSAWSAAPGLVSNGLGAGLTSTRLEEEVEEQMEEVEEREEVEEEADEGRVEEEGVW